MVLFFFYFNKDEYSDYENLITYKSTVIEIKVPGECVGQIIGSEGTHIKEVSYDVLCLCLFICKYGSF